MTAGSLTVLAPGPLSTVQDLGRPGLAELGIGRSGAADRRSLELANRLVGNPASAAGIEITFGRLVVEAAGDLLVAVTGAPCPLDTPPGRNAAMNAPFYLRDRDRLAFGTPRTGVRSYLAVRGGIAVPPVLGSRSTDLLAVIGPDQLAKGARLPVGGQRDAPPTVDLAAIAHPPDGTLTLTVVPGPRTDWFTDDALEVLTGSPYEVTSESNRIGMRLAGPSLERVRDDELPSEGMVPGALQVPPSGRPTVFLADHPVTGGYPVIAVLLRRDIDLAAQARPGQQVRFQVAGRGR